MKRMASDFVMLRGMREMHNVLFCSTRYAVPDNPSVAANLYSARIRMSIMEKQLVAMSYYQLTWNGSRDGMTCLSRVTSAKEFVSPYSQTLLLHEFPDHEYD